MRGENGTVESVIDSGADINAFDNVCYRICIDHVLHDIDQNLLVFMPHCLINTSV